MPYPFQGLLASPERLPVLKRENAGQTLCVTKKASHHLQHAWVMHLVKSFYKNTELYGFSSKHHFPTSVVMTWMDIERTLLLLIPADWVMVNSLL